jgi:hypothetical protein
VEGSPSYVAISKYYPVSLREFKFTKQFAGELRFWLLNEKQKYLVALCLFLSILFLMLPRFPVGFKWVIGFIFLALLANAFICAAVSVVVPRYQARVIWLLPLPLLLYAANREFLVRWVRKIFPNNTLSDHS